MSIRLSPRHGVNPAVPHCFYCGEAKNEVLLLGMIRGDREAPQGKVWDKEPCDKCRAWMEQGVILIGVEEALTTDPENPYRNGLWAVVTVEYITRVVEEPILAGVLKRRVAFVPKDAWKLLGLPTTQPTDN